MSAFSSGVARRTPGNKSANSESAAEKGGEVGGGRWEGGKEEETDGGTRGKRGGEYGQILSNIRQQTRRIGHRHEHYMVGFIL